MNDEGKISDVPLLPGDQQLPYPPFPSVEYCEMSDLPVTGCAHCRGEEEKDAKSAWADATVDEASQWMPHPFGTDEWRGDE